MHDPSPLWVYDEDLERKSRHEAIRDATARKRAAHRPCEIGSIDSLNVRISNSKKELQSFSVALVVDSDSTRREEEAMTAEKGKKEMTHFADVFSTKMALDSMQSGATTRMNNYAVSDSHHSEPVLVERAVFPGYNDAGPTSLPGSLKPRKLLQLVIEAQMDLTKKPLFKMEWEQLFLSKYSISIFIDCFWWYFLQKFQPNQSIQDKLFHRTAFNYVDFLRLPIEPKFKEPFFIRYPDSIAQAIYHTFCVAYPTSYKRFGEEFKDDLCSFISLWITGIQPVPRTWLTWNFVVLEPVNMFKLIADQEKSKETNLVKARGQDLAEFLGLKQLSSSSSQQMNPSQSDSSAPEGTAYASAVSIDAPSGTKVEKSGQSSRILDKKKRRRRTQSCPAGRGPDFDRFLFNLNGHSPLVSYYGKVLGMAPDTEIVQLVQRTQITKLPPLNAPTYKDIVTESLQMARSTKAGCESLWKAIAEDRRRIHVRQAAESVRDRKRAEKLLTQQKEVKRLSNLLTVDLLQPPPEIPRPVSASHEIARVLTKQEID